MHILYLGLSHTKTPVSLHEKLAFSEDVIRAALGRLVCALLVHPSLFGIHPR